MVGSFGQLGSGSDIANTGFQPNYNPSNEAGIEKGPINNEQSQGEGLTAEEGDPGSATSGNRRKRAIDYNSTCSPNKVGPVFYINLSYEL